MHKEEKDQLHNHPFADLEPIKNAQDAFEMATHGANSDDWEHLSPGHIGVAFDDKTMDHLAKFDVLLSDSATCTAKWTQWKYPDGNDYYEQDKK